MASTTDVIRVENLRKFYGKTKAVDDISFAVYSGEIFGMLGPNGAGKSTTIEMIEGLRVPDAGAVSVLGLRQPQDAKAIKQRIGIQLQTTALYPRLTVTELLDLFHTFYPSQRTVPTAELIRTVDLEEKADTRSKQLSGGQKQRLSVALALVNDPEILFLDEPTTGMDPQARRQLWDVVESLRQRGKTILMTTHYMEEAQQLCDRVAIVDHGHIIELGSPADLIQRYFTDIAIQFQDGQTSAERYAALPGVSHAATEDGRVTVYSTDVPRTMAALLEREREGGGVLQNLNVHGATLEDVFLKLTGRALRD
jgi:ABC-2 type transport system ATP-binding protein